MAFSGWRGFSLVSRVVFRSMLRLHIITYHYNDEWFHYKNLPNFVPYVP